MNRVSAGYARVRQEEPTWCMPDLGITSPRDHAHKVHELAMEYRNWREDSVLNLDPRGAAVSRRLVELSRSSVSSPSTGAVGEDSIAAEDALGELGASVKFMLQRLFRARHVHWGIDTSSRTPLLSSLLAEGAVLLVHDRLDSVRWSNGWEPTQLKRRTNLVAVECSLAGELDIDGVARAIAHHRPRLVVAGCSTSLFPYPVADLAHACRSHGSKLLFDGADTAFLIAGGEHENPLFQGAHLVTFGGVASLFGAAGWVAATNEDCVDSMLAQVVNPKPSLCGQSVTAHALAEVSEFAQAYARQVRTNAQQLAAALEEEGLEVLFRDRGYTATHQILLRVPEERAALLDILCWRANLLVPPAQRAEGWELPVIRLATHELTRRGFTAEDMPLIARLFRRLICDREDPSRIAADAHALRAAYPEIMFSFDDRPRRAHSRRLKSVREGVPGVY